MKMEVINMTPHAIVVDEGDKRRRTYEPSGQTVRLDYTTVHSGIVDGFSVATNHLVGDNLPPMEAGTLLLVSAMVLGAFPNRSDLIAPNTNQAKRDERGHIVSVPGFVR